MKIRGVLVLVEVKDDNQFVEVGYRLLPNGTFQQDGIRIFADVTSGEIDQALLTAATFLEKMV